MFEEIIGQKRIVNALKNAVLKDQISHAYLFTGPVGIGKKTLARSFAEILRCTAAFENRPCGECQACKMMKTGQSVDVLILEPETGSRTIKIRQVRDAVGRIAEKTYDGNMRICFIFGADQMTAEAQNALLKSLEEPAEQNVFLLTAESREKVLPTIQSRCQVMALDPLDDSEMTMMLEKYGAKDHIIGQLISECGGNPGQAIERLGDSAIVQLTADAFSQLSRILKGDLMLVFTFSEVMGKQKKDARIVLNDWIRGFEILLRAEKTGRMPQDSQWCTLIPSCPAGAAEKILAILFELLRRLDSNVNARLQWEAALLKICRLN